MPVKHPHLALVVLAIPAMASAADLILQQGVDSYAGTSDVSVFEERLSNANGAHPGLFVGNTRADNSRRAFIRFDLGAVPAGAEITAARLEFVVVQGKGGTRTVSAHRVTQAWSEGTTNSGGAGGRGGSSQAGDTTWSHATFPDTVWTTPGGTFAATASGSGQAQDFGALTISGAGLLADVQAFLADPSQNLGWALIGDESEGETAKKLHSRESTTTASRPKLVLTVSAPATPAEGWMLL